MTIEEALKTELSNVTSLSLKVYPLMANHGTTVPYLIYQAQGNERPETMAGHVGLIMRNFQLEIYHNSFSGLKTVSYDVVTKLKTFNFRNLASTGPYCQHCSIIDEVETYDDETQYYQSTIDISITYQEV